MSTELSYRHLTSTFLSFLTTSIHTILHVRALYPQTTFALTKKFNLPIPQSRHPAVCAWINDAVSAVETELLRCAVARVCVAILSGNKVEVLERYVFDVERFPVVSAGEIDMPIAMQGDSLGWKIGDVDEEMRAALAKLRMRCEGLPQLPHGSTFTVVMEMRGEGEAPIGGKREWVPAEKRQDLDLDEVERAKGITVPVRSVVAGPMLLETWIERQKVEE